MGKDNTLADETSSSGSTGSDESAGATGGYQGESGASGGEGAPLGSTGGAGSGATGGANVPVTVLGTYGYYGAGAVIGNQWYNPGTSAVNGCWFLVLNLTNLQVAANVFSKSNNQVPPQVQQYAGNPQYLLILVFVALRNDNLPTGALYSFLQSTGSGPKLARAEQIGAQLGTGYIGGSSYILAATMTTGDNPGFEELSSTSITIMTFQLMPVNVGGLIIYVPVSTGAGT